MSRRGDDGIEVRHAAGCAKTTRNARCSCSPAYRVRVDLSPVNGKRRQKSKTFDSLAAAKAWRSDALREVRLGALRAQTPVTLRAAAAEYVAGARDGSILNRSGERYKPSAVRGIDDAFRVRVTPALGARKLAEVKRAEIQKLVNSWAVNLSPSTVRNTVNAMRSLYRHAVSLDMVTVDPTIGLSLPAVRGGRDRVASPAEAAELLAALGAEDRPLWATAAYAGLRRGELLALRWEDVDLTGRVIHVRRSWDPDAKVFGLPKSHAGTRTVPMAAALRAALAPHRLAAPVDTTPDALVFPGRGGRPMAPNTITNRATKAWKAENAARAERAADGESPELLTPIGLHECRHTFASLMIAADVNMKQLSTWMGHATIVITMDRYGHLMPGAEADGAAKLDEYLAAHG